MMRIRGVGLRKETPCVAGTAAVVCKRQIASKGHSEEQQSQSSVSFVDMAYKNPLGLPRLPIPTLQDTVKRYLQVFKDDAHITCGVMSVNGHKN